MKYISLHIKIESSSILYTPPLPLQKKEIIIKKMLSNKLFKGISLLSFKNAPALFKVPAFTFSTLPPGKKIPDMWDIESNFLMEFANAVQECHNSEMITRLITENDYNMNETLIAYCLSHLHEYDIPLGAEFHE